LSCNPKSRLNKRHPAEGSLRENTIFFFKLGVFGVGFWGVQGKPLSQDKLLNPWAKLPFLLLFKKKKRQSHRREEMKGKF
jgi:hypothetical protein